MFVDARSIREGKVFESDVCVIGAGAAGITLALGLENSGLDIDLVESGGFELEPKTQQLTHAHVPDRDSPVATSRLRYFGGTTNHWGGTCRPLDPFEFEKHAWVPGSGWPIRRETLDPFYAAVPELIGLPNPSYGFDAREKGAGGDPRMLGAAQKDFESVLWRSTQPKAVNMGKRHRKRIGESERIRCVHHANASEVVPHASGRGIRTVEAATLCGRKFRFVARAYVLCAGAIENARILLLSNSVIPAGVGNQNDLVGRYFADHGFRNMGNLLILGHPTRRVFQEESFLGGPKSWAIRRDSVGFASTPAFRSRHRTLGFSIMLRASHVYVLDYRAAAAVEALAKEGRRDDEPEPPSPGQKTRMVNLLIVPEQSPNPDSRVRLHDERDALGQRRSLLQLRPQESDFYSRRESARQFALAVGRSGHGRVQRKEHAEEHWLMGPGGHHTGTARMSDDPSQGVTDANGRVHGFDNLYVAGSALFPTAGWQHPTLTIFALSLRMAEHLKTRLA